MKQNIYNIDTHQEQKGFISIQNAKEELLILYI